MKTSSTNPTITWTKGVLKGEKGFEGLSTSLNAMNCNVL